MEKATFAVLASIAVFGAINVVFRRNPVTAALFLVTTFLALSGLFVLMGSGFLAAIQVIVYAGAIMVLFLFVVMLLNPPQEDTEEARLRGLVAPGVTKVGGFFGLALVAELWWALTRTATAGTFPSGPVTSVGAIGRLLFTDYSFAFEVTSILILVAMVGAVVLARRDVRGTETK